MDRHREGTSPRREHQSPKKGLGTTFIDSQADVNVETTLYGYYTTLSAATPLVLAVEQQDISLIRRLLNAGADSRYPPAFVSAASTENKQIMKIILEAEANISSLSSESCGITAF